jgi:hypothetical protein
MVFFEPVVVDVNNNLTPLSREFLNERYVQMVQLDDAIKQQVRRMSRLCGYVKEPAFLRDSDEQICRFVADVHCDQMIKLQDPEPRVFEWSGLGRKPINRLSPSCGGI